MIENSCSRFSAFYSDNRKWLGLSVIAIVLVVSGAVAQAQQEKKIPRVGILSTNLAAPRIEAFRQGLRELGYEERKNVALEYRSAEGQLDRLPALAAELVRLKLDCIVTVGTPATRAAKQATSTIPIVIGNADDPVGEGFVNSLARPGGNITGLTDIPTELAGKRLELLKETIPKLSRVAVVWSAGRPGTTQWEESQRTARELRLQVHSMEIRSANDLESMFEEAIKARSGALAVAPGPLVGPIQKRIADLATKHRLPVMWAFREYVEAGGLMSYGPNNADLYRRAAAYVDKILKGAKPADLPVERPMKFELVINLKAAKQIGLTIPPNVLVRADRVIR